MHIFHRQIDIEKNVATKNWQKLALYKAAIQKCSCIHVFVYISPCDRDSVTGHAENCGFLNYMKGDCAIGCIIVLLYNDQCIFCLDIKPMILSISLQLKFTYPTTRISPMILYKTYSMDGVRMYLCGRFPYSLHSHCLCKCGAIFMMTMYLM